jgi:Chaperone of endosialidase
VVNRIQTLRSSTPGARPAGRQPGELYVNWPDLQLGVVDSASAPIDLIAVRYFSTLTSYAVGDFVVQAGALYFANAAVAPGPFNPAQWTAMKTVLDPPVGGPYLPLAGGTLTGSLFGVNAVFQGIVQSMREQITNVAGTARSLTGATSLNPRWQMNLGDATPESGANAGSNFALLAYADDGNTLLSTPIAINRATGAVTFSAMPSVPGGVAANVLSTNGAGALSWVDPSATHLPLAGGTMTGTLNGTAATFSGNINAAGETLTGTLFGADASFSGNINAAGETLTGTLFGADASFSGGVGATGNITSNAGVYGNQVFAGYPGVTDFFLAISGTNRSLYWRDPDYVTSWDSASGVMTWTMNSASAMTLGFNGDLAIIGQGTKPGGGPWVATSDARIKTIQSDYKQGLSEVLKLNPVIYTFKGNDAPPDAPSNHAKVAADATKFVGLIAQEVEPIFPDMVTKVSGWIDGVKVDDLRGLDTGPLIYALINAVKTLAARVETLEAAVIPR